MAGKRGTGRLLAAGAALACGLVGGAWAAAAEEVRQQLNAPMILNLLARPIDHPDAAFNETLRRDAAAPRLARPPEWEMMPDGSARHVGTGLTMIIKNPCPPGDLEHEAALYRSLPGRSRR